MKPSRWMRDVPAVALLLMLANMAASGMVIGDGDSAEDPDGSGSAEASSVPPTPSSEDLMRSINWSCTKVKPISNISLETIMGRWYLLETIAPNVDKHSDSCGGVDFWRWDDEENNLMPDVTPPHVVGPEHLVMRGFNRHANEHHTSSYRIDTAGVVQGSGGALWDQPVAMGASVAVLDYTPDERFITLMTCVRALGYEWTSVMGRDPNATALPREGLHQRLKATGLRHVQDAKLQDNTGCVYRYSAPVTSHLRRSQ